jgi:4-methyl-5(b-hydroxyethyl)-thiazole monophosphate biosynthesis
MSKKVLLILAGGHEEVEAITQVDLLRRVNIGVTVAGLDGTEITGAHDIAVKADVLLDDVSGDFDGVILPGGMPGTTCLAESETVLTIVRNIHEKGFLCAAICAAPLVLDRAGILEGKKYTCYPGVEEKISSGTFIDSPVVQDGNVITGRGIGTAIPFALKIVESLSGREEAESLASKIVYSGSF